MGAIIIIGGDYQQIFHLSQSPIILLVLEGERGQILKRMRRVFALLDSERSRSSDRWSYEMCKGPPPRSRGNSITLQISSQGFWQPIVVKSVPTEQER